MAASPCSWCSATAPKDRGLRPPICSLRQGTTVAAVVPNIRLQPTAAGVIMSPPRLKRKRSADEGGLFQDSPMTVVPSIRRASVSDTDTWSES
jgi:hypothetical protein